MAEILTVEVEPRDRAGKGSARAARREGLVPAVIYGDKKSPELITVDRIALARLIKRGGFLTTLLEIKLDGKTHRVLPRDLQVHPVTDVPMHVDFLRLGKGATVIIDVPVQFVDEEECPGLKMGGVINVVRHTIECRCRADSLPDALIISLAGMEIHDSAHVSAIAFPDGVQPMITDRDFTVVSIVPPTVLTAEEEAEGLEEGEEEEGLEEGEEGEGEEGEGEEGEGEEAADEGGKE